MGVTDFSLNFVNEVNISVLNDSATHIFIDGLYFWMQKIENNPQIYHYIDTLKIFSDFFIDFLLEPELNVLKENDLLNITFVFDNHSARKLMKHRKCLKRRQYNLNKNTMKPFKFTEFRKYFEKFIIEKSEKKFENNVKFNIVQAPFDADSYLIESISKIATKSTRLVTVSINDTEILYDFEISRIVLFSGDSDFLAYYPFVQDLVISCDSVNKSNNFNKILIKNAIIKQINLESVDQIFLNVFKNEDKVKKSFNTLIYLKLKACLGNNDYITCNFFDLDIFRDTLMQYYMEIHISNTVNNICVNNIETDLYFKYWTLYLKKLTESKNKQKIRALIQNSLIWLIYNEDEKIILFDFILKTVNSLNLDLKITTIEGFYYYLLKNFIYFFKNLDKISFIEKNFKNYAEKVNILNINNIMNVYMKAIDEKINDCHIAKLNNLFEKICTFSIINYFHIWFPENEILNLTENNHFKKFQFNILNLFLKMSNNDRKNYEIKEFKEEITFFRKDNEQKIYKSISNILFS